MEDNLGDNNQNIGNANNIHPPQQNMINSSDSQSYSFGIISFVFSLAGIGVFMMSGGSTLIRVVSAIVFIVSILFAIIQRKRVKSKLSIFSLIISKIGLIIAIIFLFVTVFVFGAVKADFEEQVRVGTSCFDVVVSSNINEACIDGSNINVDMQITGKTPNKGIFYIDDIRIGEYELTENLIIQGNGNELSVSGIAESGECEISSKVPIESSC